MNLFAPSHFRRWLLTAAVGGALAISGRAGEKKKEDSNAGGINLPIAVGHEAKGVKLPYIDAKGKLQMNFSIGIAHRTDEAHLTMSNLIIETYNEAGKPDMTFDLPTSIYDVETHILLSDHPVKIRRVDFELTGETMEFNTTTRQGVLRGKVRMLIFNRDEVSEPKDAEPSASNSETNP